MSHTLWYNLCWFPCKHFIGWQVPRVLHSSNKKMPNLSSPSTYVSSFVSFQYCASMWLSVFLLILSPVPSSSTAATWEQEYGIRNLCAVWWLDSLEVLGLPFQRHLVDSHYQFVLSRNSEGAIIAACILLLFEVSIPKHGTTLPAHRSQTPLGTCLGLERHLECGSHSSVCLRCHKASVNYQ